MIRAVIFDMDGLMIDSEPFHYKAFRKIFNSFGKELTQEEHFKRYVGISDIDAAIDMVTTFNIPLSPEEFVRRKQAQYLILLQDQIVPQPGLIELLERLQQNGYKKAIASSSILNEIKSVINALHIAPFINSYCSAEQVSKGKPAPDIFLLAAEKLGVKPQECLVLEDGPSGIDAAIAAKMICYAIPSRETKNLDFSKANRILDSLAEVFYYMLLDSSLPVVTQG